MGLFDEVTSELVDAVKKLGVFSTRLEEFTRSLEKLSQEVRELSDRVTRTEADREVLKFETLRLFERQMYEVVLGLHEKIHRLETQLSTSDGNGKSVKEPTQLLDSPIKN